MSPCDNFLEIRDSAASLPFPHLAFKATAAKLECSDQQAYRVCKLNAGGPKTCRQVEKP